jgi:hypothetical protein
MPRLSTTPAEPRPDLAVLLEEHIEQPTDFIAGEVFTDFPVQEKSSQFPVIPLEALLEMPASIKRRPRGEYARGDWEFEMDDFNCTEDGWEEPVDETEAKLYARYFNAEQIAMKRAMGIVRRVREKAVSSAIFNASNFTAHAVTNEWDDATNATPIADVATGRNTIREATGMTPNTLILPYKTFYNCNYCDEIIDRIKYTQPQVARGQVTRQMLAGLFDVEQVLVPGGMYNSAKKGQSATLANIWDPEYAMLCITSKSEDALEPCIGRMFRWVADCPANMTVESYVESKIRSTVIRVRQHIDLEFIMSGCAYLMSNMYTT